VVSAPSVQSAITDPTTQISASQTEAQASELAARMELGRFGVQYTVISTQVVR
jgi:preprotein translocase subunit SecD